MMTALCLSGCVYYNTFYHARTAAHEAALLREARAPDAPPGAREAELLDRVAEKCTRILELHPDSSWADDALLLLGETRYHQERYDSAEDHLNDFLARHPGSELRPQAEYLLASVLIESGNPVAAETILEGIAYAQPPGDLADDALALIGQARHKRGRFEEAASAFADVLPRFPGSDRRAEVRYLAAQNYEAMGELDEAARQYESVMEERGSRAIAFEARMRLAEVNIARDRGREALEVLDELERRTEDREQLDEVRLLRGRALESLGRYDEAVSNYEDIAASRQRTEASAKAYYRIGLILRDRDEQLEEASESFRKAREEAPRSDVAAVATDAARDIEILMGHLATIEEHELAKTDAAPVDSSPAAPETSPAREDTVEAVPDEPGDLPPETAPDDSMTATAPADTGAAADSVAAPAHAAAAMASGDTTAAADTVAWPAHAATAMASEDTAAAESEKPRDRVAVARFRAAELYMFRLDDPERALIYYRAVVEKHPGSALAPKAALATAWIYDKKLLNPSRARMAYESVIDDYPGTEFADAARESLSGIRLRSQP